MAGQPDLPFPPSREGGGTTGDRRAYFESLSQQTERDPAAEQAFIQSKLDLVRSDPTLSDAEKERAIAELRQRLGV